MQRSLRLIWILLGNYFYQVEGVDDTNEFELKIDAETKETSEERTEKLDADEQNGVKKMPIN